MAAFPTQKEEEIKPKRGNIYSCDGQLMASSVPIYRLHMDTQVEALHVNDGKLFKEYIDSVSTALSSYFKDRSASEYKRLITQGYNKGARWLLLQPRHISYMELKEVMEFPLFNKGRNKSGLIPDEQTRRERPFGTLANRTIGYVYGNEEKGGSSGLEKYFDKELRGVPGKCVTQKAANQSVRITQKEPISGADIISTIDIDLQDIAEYALLQKLKQLDAQLGSVILMEVKSGEVKAIVNMEKTASGGYAELRNTAVGNLDEPGSTFKIASLMAAIDDGYVSIYDSVDVGNGKYQFYDRTMTDHNAHKGGYGNISVQNAIEASSNVGVSRVINDNYKKNPSKFVEKLYEMGLNEPLDLEIPGAALPKIRKPNDTINKWYGTTLPWMSIGYDVQIPPIYTLAFYNAIANDGKMIKPYFVKEIRRENETIETFSTKVIRSSICKDETLRQIKTALEGVVWSKRYGTAKQAQSNKIRIAGKTGTAQLSEGKGGYSGQTHIVSFCGYFPIEEPLYTAICVIRKPRIGAASGGAMCATVVRDIAERAQALHNEIETDEIQDDTTFVFEQPYVKAGLYRKVKKAARKSDLHISNSESEWSKFTKDKNNTLATVELEISEYFMPNVVGMGASDALYAVERTGMQVELEGMGRVVRQSVIAGTRATEGRRVTLILR